MARTLTALALVAILTASTMSEVEARDGHRRDAAAGALLGAALIGAAALAASSHDHRHEHHRPAYRDPPRRNRGPFSPARNVTCYPGERACYRRNGNFAGKWTRRIYGY